MTNTLHHYAMKSVEIFKTNVQEDQQANELIGYLNDSFPTWKINFDLADCDKILKIEGPELQSDKVIELFALNGFYCEILT